MILPYRGKWQTGRRKVKHEDSSWYMANDLFFNKVQSKVMVVGSKTKLRNLPSIELNVKSDNIRLERVPNHKVLGLVIDKHLSWENQVATTYVNKFQLVCHH